jgi:hypothetical protein
MFSTALTLSAVAALAPAATISWLPVDRPVAVEVQGIVAATPRRDAADPAWAQTLAVFAEQGAVMDVPPMVGTWRAVSGNRIRFEPRFPLTRGVRYRAEYRVAGAAPMISYFALPADTTLPSTTVLNVFPSADVLPENQLKFYVQFSAPMSRGRTYEHVHIRDAAGRVIELPFLELEEELWDPTMTRLTLLIDPGRIKRGVKPLVDIGPVFEVGRIYSLTIGGACRDAEDRPLRTVFEKKFRIGPADRIGLDPARWKIIAPSAGTRAPLAVAFDESLDHALALRMIRVVQADGAELDGEVTLGPREETWRFVPDRAWRGGAYLLVVPTTIEDLAGNNVGKAFDVDVFEEVHRHLETPTVEVAFAVK